jgi:hypothetical protein
MRFYFFLISVEKGWHHVMVTSLPPADWLQALCKSQPIAAKMLARSPEEQHRLG